jgi:hypothetical protein
MLRKALRSIHISFEGNLTVWHKQKSLAIICPREHPSHYTVFQQLIKVYCVHCVTTKINYI